MIDPLTKLIRTIAIRKNRSTVETGILPLSGIKKATLFTDNMDADSDQVAKEARKYFEDKGIALKVIQAESWDVNIFGMLKKHKGEKPWNEELFISTAYAYNFTGEYAARCSKARFKVGREQLSGNIFDIVLNDPDGKIIRQPVAFREIIKLLEKIK